MANNFYNRNSSFNPDELADGDAIEAEFDAIVRGFDTIGTAVDANKPGYPSQTFHVAQATLDTHAVPKAQMETALSFKLDAVNYNATDILSKLKTVDGTDSGLDADYLDGQHGSYYRNADNINAGTLAKERLPGTIDSSTTGTAANAELLDGLDSTRFSRSAVGQLNNYDNWDAFTAHGTYKVHSPDFAGNANAPPSTYGYGILQVEVSEIGGENRTNQVYYPHNFDIDKYIYQRMSNGGVWTAWSKIWRGGTGPNSGLQASKVSDIAPIGDGRNLVEGQMAGDDFFRLRVYSDVYDGGAVELATADGGNEPILVRQYNGLFGSVARTLTLLDGSGNTVIPGGVWSIPNNAFLNTVSVLSGTIVNGSRLPIPGGYQEWQCRFFISMNNTNPYDHPWNLEEWKDYSEYCRLVNTRQVEALTRVYNDARNAFQYHEGIVNYIVIGVK